MAIVSAKAATVAERAISAATAIISSLIAYVSSSPHSAAVSISRNSFYPEIWFLDCNCDVKGTLPGVCDKSNGQCLCKPGYGGPRCDQCVAGFSGFPDCKPCNCSSVGSAFSVCDVTGKCTCLTNYAGKLCDQCSPGYYQYPNCLRKYLIVKSSRMN